MRIYPRSTNTRFISILTVLILLAFNTLALAEESFDVPGSLKASEILPADLIKHEHFTVREEVTWFDGLHQFTVDTEYGSFEIWGEPMLRVRLQEFIAWNYLKDTSSASAGAYAVGETAFRSVAALLNAFAHPITTIKGVPQGISRMFTEVGRDIGNVVEVVTFQEHKYEPGSLDRHDVESGLVIENAEILVGVNNEYRRWAKKAGVNPYTSNVAVQEELNRLAKTDAYLSAGTWLIAPNISGDLAIVAQIAKSVYDKNWHEVVEDNKKSLVSMGVDDKRIEDLLSTDLINLSLLSLMIETLVELDGVEDRKYVIDQIKLLETESEVIWFAESLLMAEWFHQNEAPIGKMLPDTLVPVALTKDNRVIAYSAADYAYWDEDSARVSAEFTTRYEKYSDKREAWIADQASPRFIEGLGKLGWTVKSGIRSTVLPEIPWGLQDRVNNLQSHLLFF